MGLKTVIFFISTCFVVLVSLEAIADDISGAHASDVRLFFEGQKETLKSPDNNQEVPQQCEEETKATELSKKVPADKSAVTQRVSKNSNLSFNFIYYILYKFKYIDSFGLSTPEKSRVTKEREDLLWH